MIRSLRRTSPALAIKIVVLDRAIGAAEEWRLSGGGSHVCHVCRGCWWGSPSRRPTGTNALACVGGGCFIGCCRRTCLASCRQLGRFRSKLERVASLACCCGRCRPLASAHLGIRRTHDVVPCLACVRSGLPAICRGLPEFRRNP